MEKGKLTEAQREIIKNLPTKGIITIKSDIGKNAPNLLKLAKDKYRHGKLVGKRFNMKQVNEAIQKIHPEVELVKGEGYYYIAGTTDAMALTIAGFYESSIYIYKLNQQTIERWVEDVNLLMKQTGK